MSSFDSACLSEVEVCCGHFLKLVGGGEGGGGGIKIRETSENKKQQNAG